MKNKTDLRLWAKSLRKALDMQAKSLIIAKNIRHFDCYKSARHVMLWYPKGFEVNLLSLLDDDKCFYLPKVCGKELLVCPYKKSDNLLVSEFKVCEPCSAPVSPDLIDLVLVPALVVDKNNYRLGYGGGFYDRFLQKNKIKSVVAIPKELVIEVLPVEVTDVPVDLVITD